MHELPRQTLQELIARYGDTLVDNPRRTRALLMDLCGEYRPEIFILTTAQEEQVPDDLLDIQNGVPTALLVAQLTKRLMENRALNESAARWAVESWALALGMEITPIESLPSTPPPMHASAPVSAAQAAPPKPLSLTSPYPTDVIGRESSEEDAEWQKLGQTPQTVAIPSHYELGLRPHISATQLSEWANSLTEVKRVVWLDLDDVEVTDIHINALRTFPNLRQLEIKKGDYLTDKGFATLGMLRGLQTLSVAWSKVTGRGLAHLANLKHLTQLELRESKRIGDPGLVHLKVLPHLKQLDLAGCTQITDRGMSDLAQLASLVKLNLSRCPQITHRGLAPLRVLTSLTYLDLSGNPRLGDRALMHLRTLTNLTSLNLAQANITNTGLGYIRALTHLIYLNLSWCSQISNRGLNHLDSLRSLAYLNLTGCDGLTSRGIRRLKRPGLFILE